MERKSPINGLNFLITFTNGLLNTPEGTLSQLAAFMGSVCGTQVTPQAIDERINELGMNFLRHCLARAMNLSARPLSLDNKFLKFLDHIYIIDSTNFDIHRSLKDSFKGTHGSASEASLRIQFVYDYLTGRTYVEIGDVTLSDARTLNDIIRTNKLDTRGNCLFLSDLGYFKADTFLKIDQKDNCFFLSRFRNNIKIFDLDGHEIDLLKIMKRKPAQIDMRIKIGDLECRLIGKQLPPEAINKKLRQINLKNQRKGRTISKEYRLFITYSLFITNLSDEFNFDVLYTLYRIRWQIELVFKTWKSILKIHCIHSARKERVLCQVYGKLIIAVLSNFIYFNSQVRAECNLSLHRTIQHIKAIAVVWTLHIFQGRETLKKFMENMDRQIIRSCKKNVQKSKPNIEILLEELILESIVYTHV